MKCPVCKDVNLLIAERQGVEIDYCPQCRGVWLDRGELDKIIERSRSQMAPYHEPEVYHYPSKPHEKAEYYHKKKKPKSLLEELFDF